MRTGDTVLHKPTGERWVVAFVDGPRLSWVGWPPGYAKTSDCELVKECGDDESNALLKRLAEMKDDARGRWARYQLEQD